MSDGSVFAYPKLRGERPYAKDEPALGDAMGGFSIDDYRSMNGNETYEGEILLQGGSLQFDYAPQPGGHFQLVQENEWSKEDAATMGMTPQQIQEFQEKGGVETVIGGKPATGTDTSTGNREAPAPTKRTAADVVKGFGNDYGSMKSQGLAAALRGAQESIIQKRMDAGEDFGFKNTATTIGTTVDPSNFESGISSVADIADQTRNIDFPEYNPDQFKVDFMKATFGDMFKNGPTLGVTYKDFIE